MAHPTFAHVSGEMLSPAPVDSVDRAPGVDLDSMAAGSEAEVHVRCGWMEMETVVPVGCVFCPSKSDQTSSNIKMS